MKFKFPKLPNLPKLPKFPKLSKPRKLFHIPHLSKIKIKPVRKSLIFLFRHKAAVVISVIIVSFVSLAMWYRGYLLSKMDTSEKRTNSDIFYYHAQNNPLPTLALPTTPEVNLHVLGSADYSAPVYKSPIIHTSPYPTLPPLPTLVPVPTSSSNSSSNNGTNTGNPNCSTGTGEANSWYSDVYPNPPINTTTGSVEMVVVLRDCNKQTVQVDDTLKISLSSGDQNTKINGNSLPYTLTAQNGQASFYVSSQTSGTVTLVVQDTTKSFTITDINNHNPSITFSNNASGNSNCNSGAGVANAWYSDVYPASPQNTNVGSSVTFSVVIRDCNKNQVSTSDNLAISQTSNDSGLKINGSSPPVSITASNGQASFSVSSPNAGTINLSVSDTSNSFGITDVNNHNPSVVFNSISNTSPSSTPIPTSGNQTTNPTSTPLPQPTQGTAPTSTPAVTSQTSSPTPAPSPTQTQNPTPTSRL
ncbi:MAG: hypothetical protein M1366_02910 [Patescibacteria group bacterium]|nr:hypothetical protein [Patescibacteria group bacterium]